MLPDMAHSVNVNMQQIFFVTIFGKSIFRDTIYRFGRRMKNYSSEKWNLIHDESQKPC